MTKSIAPIVTVTPQQALGKALARGVIVDSGKQLQIKNIKLLFDVVK